ncbi:8906_t:CDS:2, partial [Funneliformis geosporum]
MVVLGRAERGRAKGLGGKNEGGEGGKLGEEIERGTFEGPGIGEEEERGEEEEERTAVEEGGMKE